MRRTKNQQELEKILIEEEYDPVTLEERPEDERLLLDNANGESEKISAEQMVKMAYAKVDNGYAIVREHLKPIGIIVMCVFLAVPILFLTFFIINKWWQNGVMIFACLFFSCGAILVAYLIVYRGFIKDTKKLFDVYYFQQGKKRIVIYQNRKYTIYYRNRKELICIENKTKKWVKNYERADCMNLKLGFNSLVGDLQCKRNKKGGFEIWTPARYDTSTQLHIFSGFASLKIDGENNPVKILIGGGSYTSYIYEFRNDVNFKVLVPNEMITVCKQLNIEPPKENQWLTFV